jgi:hypothetical protein
MVVGPMVTNPGTRDWSVIASLFATLNDMYGNRTVCGIGRGDSARRVIGQAPMSLATLSEAMTVIKGLAEGREVEHHGQPLRIPWVRDGKLEIWMAAYGPKALRLAGEQADGFILQTADPDIARWTIGSVRRRRAAGRDPSSITMCVAAPAYVGDRPAAPAGAAALVRRHGGQPRRGPGGAVRHRRAGPPRADRLHRGPQGYDYAHHGKADNPSWTSCRTRSWTGSACSARRPRTWTGCASWPRSAPTSSPCYLMHDDEEATLAAYGGPRSSRPPEVCLRLDVQAHADLHRVRDRAAGRG